MNLPQRQPDPNPQVESEALLIGPMLVASTVGVQITIWFWRTIWQRSFSPAELDRYTSLVLPLGHPDFDRPIYFGGMGFCLLLAAVLYLVWRRRLRAAQSPEQLGMVRRR